MKTALVPADAVRRSWGIDLIPFWLSLVLGWGTPRVTVAQTNSASPTEKVSILTNAAAILRLPRDQAGHGLPAQLRGVVTYADARWRILFVQDQTAGLYVQRDIWDSRLNTGDLVEVVGRTHSGGFTPVVLAAEIRRVGQAPLPQARFVHIEEMATGRQDAQWVKTRAVVRTVKREGSDLHFKLAGSGGYFTVYVPDVPDQPLPEHWIDAEVRLRGVCGVQLDLKGVLVGFHLFVPSLGEIQPVQALLGERQPFFATNVAEVVRTNSANGPGHRVTVRGVVTYQRRHGSFFMQDPSGGLYIRSRQRSTLQSGDHVEVTGFPVPGGSVNALEDTVYQRIGSGLAPAPIALTAAEAATGKGIARLIKVRGRLTERTAFPDHLALVVREGRVLFEAKLDTTNAAVVLTELRPGAVLSLTGLCLVETDRTPNHFHLLLRSPEDVAVLQPSPWWTVRRALVVLGVLTLLYLAWVILGWKRESALKEQRHRLAAILEATSDLVGMADKDGQVLYLNRAGRKLLGLGADEAIEGTPISNYHPKWAVNIILSEGIPAATRDGTWEGETALLTRDGREVPASQVLIAHTSAAGGVEYLATIMRDITEPKRTEENLRHSRAQFESLVNTIDGIVWELDLRSYRFTFVSQQAERLLGYPLQRWLTEPDFWKDHIHPEDREWAYNYCLEATRKHQDHEFEYRMIAADGRTVWLRDFVTIVFQDGQAAKLRGVIVDTTQQKQAEEALKKSQQQFESLVNTIDGIVWEAELNSFRITFISQQVERILGYPVSSWLAGPHRWMRRLHPDDRERAFRQFREAVAAREDTVLECRALTADGRTVWLRAPVALVMQGGQPVKLRGVAVDITPSKQMEQDLRDSEVKTRAILDNVVDGIFTMDEQGRLESFNPAAAHLFGYDPGEILGRNIRLIIPRPYLREHESYQTDFIRRGAPKLLNPGREVIGRRKDGATLPCELAVSEVRLGQRRTFTAIVRDITERKKAQEELTNSRELLRFLAARLQSIREEERTRIAREVHDELGQALTGIKMDLSWLTTRLPAETPGVLARARSMAGLIDSTIQTVRRIATELRPGVLDNLGLVAALEWQAADFQARTGLECRCEAQLDEASLPSEHRTALFRIFQETLTNVARHAQASRVTVTLREEHGQVILEVQDNGRGIEPAELSGTKSLGLLGIRERASILGGSAQISGTPGQGTTVRVRIPFDPAREPSTQQQIA